jgi:hypothetical protein
MADDQKRTATGSLGAGAEAAAAIHADQPDASKPSDAQHGAPGAGAQGAAAEAVTGRGGDGDADRAGSEPLDRDREHKPSYGGEGGSPRTSSDTREPINPS